MNDALLEVVHGRANPHIDPSLHIWGWEIPVYLFLGGLAAGTLILAAVLELRAGERPRSAVLRMAPFLSVLLLSLGMGALFLDLEYKWHVYRFYLGFLPRSPMSWGSWILVAVYPVALLAGLGGLADGERAALLRFAPIKALRLDRPLMCLLGIAEGRRRGLLVTAAIVGVALALYTGVLLGAMSARPQWNSGVLGPLFLSSGLSTGAALLLLFPMDKAERHTLVLWDVGAIVAEMLLIGALMVGFAAGDRSAQLAFSQLTAGPYGAAFWSLVVVMGLGVPLAMEAVELKRHLPLVRLTPVLVLLGGLSLRWILLLSGQATGFRNLP